jgi:LacI family transcriptional regulator
MTIKDIAKAAGVSHSTVSRSLSDSPLIPSQTREKIKAIAQKQGYRVNAIARSLSLGRASCIALIYPEYFERPSINWLFSNVLSCIRKVLERERLDVMVAFPRNLDSGASGIERLASEHKVDGMLIIGDELEQGDLKCLSDSQVPYVFIHRRPECLEMASADYVCTDHVLGGRLAGERLLSLNRRRLACVSAIGEEFEARSLGFSAALADAGLDPEAVPFLYGDCSFEFGAGEGARFVLGVGHIDGVFCQTDLMALGLIQGLLDAGLRLPEEVSVVGYDDIELGVYLRPRLTTIHQPLAEMANLACERLIRLVAGKREGSLQKLIAPSLVVRES